MILIVCLSHSNLFHFQNSSFVKGAGIHFPACQREFIHANSYAVAMRNQYETMHDITAAMKAFSWRHSLVCMTLSCMNVCVPLSSFITEEEYILNCMKESNKIYAKSTQTGGVMDS